MIALWLTFVPLRWSFWKPALLDWLTPSLLSCKIPFWQFLHFAWKTDDNVYDVITQILHEGERLVDIYAYFLFYCIDFIWIMLDTEVCSFKVVDVEKMTYHAIKWHPYLFITHFYTPPAVESLQLFYDFEILYYFGKSHFCYHF